MKKLIFIFCVLISQLSNSQTINEMFKNQVIEDKYINTNTTPYFNLVNYMSNKDTICILKSDNDINLKYRKIHNMIINNENVVIYYDVTIYYTSLIYVNIYNVSLSKNIELSKENINLINFYFNYELALIETSTKL